MANILIIDDDVLFTDYLRNTVEQLGHTAVAAHTLYKGLEQCRSCEYDVIILDVRLPDGNGINSIGDFKAAPSEPEIIIVTGDGDQDGAALAIENGAWDYMEKPGSYERISLPLLRALEFRRRKGVSQPTLFHRNGVVGSSNPMQTCLSELAHAAADETNVLLVGETGTGKELFARTIHVNSRRVDGPFVPVDCGSLPETLIEAELFGHVKGAFTGADQERAGLIGQADGGTLFLDEIGELPLREQTAFLRVLQERRYRPLGGGEERPSDFRLIAATNKNLQEMVQTSLFRLDLLYRINSFTIHIPPLRNRGQDIIELALARLDALYRRNRQEPKEIAQDFFDALLTYSWPGNVRELHNAIEHALAAGRPDAQLYRAHLPTHVRVAAAQAQVQPNSSRASHAAGPDAESNSLFRTAPPPWKEYRQKKLDDIERDYLEHLLLATCGNITHASDVSGLSRQRLHALLRKHGIRRTFDFHEADSP